MAANPVLIDPTVYATAANSVFGKVTATLAELGRSEIGKEFVHQRLDDYFGRLPGLVEMKSDNAWLADHTDIEDGDSSFVWGQTEYAVGKLAEAKLGYSSTNTPEKVNSNALFSLDEVTRASSRTDKHFKMFVAEKVMKANRDIVNGILSRFLTEVLNKTDDVLSTYLHPDGKPTLAKAAAPHAYNNGVYTFVNFLEVAAAGIALDEAGLDLLRALETGMKDSSGITPLDYAYDTLIVSAGSAHEKSAMQLTGVTDAMAIARASVSLRSGMNQALFPQTHGQINIYQGSMKVISVKGMDAKLWLAVDSSKEAPIKFRVVSFPSHTGTVNRENGTRLEMFHGFVDFWAKLMPKFVAGSRSV